MPKKASKKKIKLKDYLYVINKAKSMGITDVGVAVSCGRDSVVTLDMCKEHFSRVEGFFMYVMNDLQFQQKYLRYLERRYDMKILQVPHFMLSQMFRAGVYRRETKRSLECPRLRPKDVYEYVKRKLGVKWIATGERKQDSLERRAQISSVDGVNEKRGIIYPLAEFSSSEVQAYMDRKHIMHSPEYELGTHGNRSYVGSMIGKNLTVIKEHFPNDYARILKRFPLAEASIMLDQMREKKLQEMSMLEAYELDEDEGEEGDVE